MQFKHMPSHSVILSFSALALNAVLMSNLFALIMLRGYVGRLSILSLTARNSTYIIIVTFCT